MNNLVLHKYKVVQILLSSLTIELSKCVQNSLYIPKKALQSRKNSFDYNSPCFFWAHGKKWSVFPIFPDKLISDRFCYSFIPKFKLQEKICFAFPSFLQQSASSRRNGLEKRWNETWFSIHLKSLPEKIYKETRRRIFCFKETFETCNYYLWCNSCVEVFVRFISHCILFLLFCKFDRRIMKDIAISYFNLTC